MFGRRKLFPLLASALVLAATLATTLARAQGYVETFGQNRVQNRKFDWKFFDTKHFRVYHYDRSGRQLGRYVAEEAENSIKVIEQKMGGQFPDRFSIILYNSYDDYRQTNVGLKDESQISQMTISGTWNLTGDKLVVYHTGNHTDLQRQIRAGMAQVVMERMIYGESFKKMAKTELLMNLPPWVTEGFIAYLTDGWNTETNSEWKRLLDASPKTGFYEFSEEHPEIAGKAFWKFVSDNYGKAKMRTLLSEMQQKTSLNKAMKNKDNLNLKITKAYDSCMKYYRNVYALDFRYQDLPDSSAGIISLKVPKDNTIIRNIMVSPRGSEIAYIAWKDGRFTIYSQKTAYDQVRSVLLEGGEKDMTEEIDPNYPMMAWSAGGNKLAILYKKGKRVNLRIYNSFKGRIENYIIPPNRFDRVLGMSFMEDDDKLVFSAIRKSQTDLYQFTIKGSKMTNITDDAWDDINPVFVSGGSRKGILFLSNRPKPNMNVPVEVNQLPNGPMNVYFYNTTTQRSELLQCSHLQPGQKILQPIQYGTDNFAYLYDEHGIMNKYVVMFGRDRRNMDSAYALPVTNYNTSIISHQYNMASGNAADVIQEKNKYMVYFHKLDMPGDSGQPKQPLPTILSSEQPEVQDILVGTGLKLDQSNQPMGQAPALPEVKNGTAFQSEFTDTVTGGLRRKHHKTDAVKVGADKTISEADSSTLAVITDSAYVKMKPSPYRLSFKPDGFNVRLDNSILFSQYQPYAANNGTYKTPNLGLLTTINMIELMEDHKITAGFQLPLDLSSSAYFLQYKNTRKRLDWSVLALRTQTTDVQDYVYKSPTSGYDTMITQKFKNVTSMVQSEVSYPFDRLRSLHIHTALRQDMLIEKATDKWSLQNDPPNTTAYWSLSRVEYIYDNTRTPQLNIHKGTRYKLYTEYMTQLNGQNINCYNFGIDFRTYQPLYKNIIWATKFAMAHSDGTAKVQYQLGGVDNWYKPQIDNNSISTGNYGFMMLANNLRGYKQGAQKGNTYGLINTEVRVPIVSTFFKRPAQSALLKNLQFVAFADGGSAYDGFLPGKETTTRPILFAYNSNGIPTNVLMQVNVISTSEFIYGYGVGLRTMLFGYFVRADVSLNGSPIVYFALGTDF